MKSRKTNLVPVRLSLVDLLGLEYCGAVCEARQALTGEDARSARQTAKQRVDFYPAAYQRRLLELLNRVGEKWGASITATAAGATSDAFRLRTHTAFAPVSALGYFRAGEDGRLYLTAKSEHYHAPLGHAFPGYELITHARRLGVPNATHNNTRGHITRLLEEELVLTAAGLANSDTARLSRVLASRRSTDINRVLNLQTGSLALEAALKMVLARFYRSGPGAASPPEGGRTPVIVVVGSEEGNLQANYHGTTMATQLLRGLWPELVRGLESKRLLRIRAVRPNVLADLDKVFAEHNRGASRIAGFFHEIVLMNYGAMRLRERFLKHAYALCRKHDVPTVVDEIQTCLWSPELYMFREYGLKPTMVAVGKGFAGGEYAASRLLFSAPMDTLPQFGALVTNGQEELASLAYLVTMRWAEANAEVTRSVGQYYEDRLKDLAARHKTLLRSAEGRRHLGGIYFHELDSAEVFARQSRERGIDLSVQSYKTGCPPSALTKLPLTAGYEVVDFMMDRFEEILGTLEKARDRESKSKQ